MPELSNDRRELMRRIAQDGRRILVLEAKLRKVPEGTQQRYALLQELRPIQQRQAARLLRVRGVAG